MRDWRQILSWKISFDIDRDIRVGDKVKVIATPELMRVIDLSPTRIGKVFTVTHIKCSSPVWRNFLNTDPGAGAYVGNIVAGIEGFPYSHWRDFLKIVGVADD